MMPLVAGFQRQLFNIKCSLIHIKLILFPLHSCFLSCLLFSFVLISFPFTPFSSFLPFLMYQEYLWIAIQGWIFAGLKKIWPLFKNHLPLLYGQIPSLPFFLLSDLGVIEYGKIKAIRLILNYCTWIILNLPLISIVFVVLSFSCNYTYTYIIFHTWALIS